MATLPPVTQNGVNLVMTKPSNSPQNRTFTASASGVGRNGRGLPLITTDALIGGLSFTVTNPAGLTTKTRVNGLAILLQGAVIVASDGYTGTVDVTHTSGPTLRIS